MMKTSALVLALTVTLLGSNLASAQQQYSLGSDPVSQNSSGLQTSQFCLDGTWTPAVRQPAFVEPIRLYLPVRDANPVVHQTKPRLTRMTYDPYTGRWSVRTVSHEVKASALDANRHIVDPGSRRAKSSTSRDADGTVYEVSTVSWTSYGVPHSKTTRRVIRSGSPYGNIQESVNVSHMHMAPAVITPGPTQELHQNRGRN